MDFETETTLGRKQTKQNKNLNMAKENKNLTWF